MNEFRNQLVAIALEWQKNFGVAPLITPTISEFDAAKLVGMSEDEYSIYMQNQTAVQGGHDFIYKGIRYQVKANRPSGKRGSKVTLVPKAKNYNWDILIWILYNKQYELIEAWSWDVNSYKNMFHDIKRLSPDHYRQGNSLLDFSPKSERRVKHLVERMGLQNLVGEEDRIWESGFWPIPETEARGLIDGDIYFHKSRDEISYMGGQIVGYRIAAEGKWKGRVIFLFRICKDHVGVAWDASRE